MRKEKTKRRTKKNKQTFVCIRTDIWTNDDGDDDDVDVSFRGVDNVLL